MLIISILVVLIIVGIIIDKYTYNNIGEPVAVISGVVLVFILIPFPPVFYGTKSEIMQFKSIKITVQNARNNGVNIENAAIQQKIIDANKWLANYQYWNNTIFDIYIPDEIMELEPLE